MAKYSSSSVALLVDGYDLTAALTESITRSTEILTEPTMPLGGTAQGATPVGLVQGAIAVGGGYFDEAVDLLHAGIADGGLSNTPAATPRIVCVFNEGHTIGNRFTGYAGAYSQRYEPILSNGALTKANVNYQITGRVDEGQIVQALAAQTVTWNTKSTPVDQADDPTARRVPVTSSSVANPSVITTTDAHGFVTGDVVAIFAHAASTPDINDTAAAQVWTAIGHTITVTGTNTFTIPVNVTVGGTGGYVVRVSWASGGYGYQQVVARSGITANIGEIEHSVDASTWADLITFTNTASGANVAERKATATSTTVVRRYLAHVGTLTTAGSTTVFSGFARGS